MDVGLKTTWLSQAHEAVRPVILEKKVYFKSSGSFPGIVNCRYAWMLPQ